VSSYYETAPQGFGNQPSFVNAACELWTHLDPFQLMHELHKVELSIGRGRAFVNAPRTLDIDILIYDETILQTPMLSIPHPRMAEREFVLRPLAELAPELVHPVSRQTIRFLLKELTTPKETVSGFI
jgi:2-amino-4-hydroxy-6-hydroxymethyldihydropteridine diphosphokinase